MKFYVLFLPFVLIACGHLSKNSQPLAANPADGAFADRSATSNARVVLIPQWHLSPQTNTREDVKTLPQNENQKAIYLQLDEWIQNRQLDNVIVEGCEGEITSNFPTKFNGWTMEELLQLPPDQLANTMTQIGMKVKAKNGEHLHVYCGDDLALIKRHQLILSDLRGLLGFKMRLLELQGNPRQETYLKSVKEVLKLDPKLTSPEVRDEINATLKRKIDEFDVVLKARDDAFIHRVETSQAAGQLPVAIVIGALHIPDLKSRLEAKQISTIVFEPRGLAGDEWGLIDQIKELINQN